MHTTHSDPHLEKCLSACQECHDKCEHMFYQHCLELGGKHVEAEHAKLMADCAQICRTAADFMQRGSPRHAAICQVCADICDTCADDCERIGEMDDCVTACRHCAATCREMAH